MGMRRAEVGLPAAGAAARGPQWLMGGVRWRLGVLGLFRSEKEVWEDMSASSCEAGTGCALNSPAVAGAALSTESCGPADCAAERLLVLCSTR